MIIGLIVFFGWFVRLMADIADKSKNISFMQHFVFFLTAGIFYVIQAYLNLETELPNKFSIAVYMLLLATLGYLPGHFWDKINSFFIKKADRY